MATTRAKVTEPTISPLSSAEESRKQLLGSADEKHQSTLGQFLSPLPVAQFMASMFAPVSESAHRHRTIRICHARSYRPL